jgi:SAM-dependent methyltransferase
VKRYLLRDVARSLRSHARFRYMIAVVRKLGGVHPRECSLCGYHGLFHAFGHPPRYDALCPECGSRERHRLLGLLLAARPGLGRGTRTVHFAPEPLLASEFRRRAADYRTADLFAPGCDLRLDIEDMDLADGSVDLFVVNHVLEHVDQRKALPELFRCLAPGGVAILTTPVVEGWRTTYENPPIAAADSDADRILHFGWPDHLRWFGADIRGFIAQAGFELSEFTGSGEEAVRFGLIRGETIFEARKPER